MCLQAVQVYVNRTVPENQQGGIFGLQQVQENALNLCRHPPARRNRHVTGPQYVFLFAPCGGALGLALISYSFRHTTGKTPHLTESIDFLIEDLPPQEIHDVRSKPKPDRE